PGPRVDWMNEATRFFAHWLRAENTGIMDEPGVSIYMQEYAVPDRTMDITPGHWRNDADFPVTGAKEVTFYLDENGKLAEKTSEGSDRKSTRLNSSHEWISYAVYCLQK